MTESPDHHPGELPPFARRHLGPRDADLETMCAAIGVSGVDELLEQAVPADIRDDTPLDLPTPVDEATALAELRSLAGRNRRLVSLLGLGYHGTVTPAVIRRNVIENPAWYTAYTPYQPEISQGRLEALLIFQTMVAELTGCPVANASLLDEATAAAEAMALMHRAARSGDRLVVDPDCHPQTRAVIATRAAPLGLEVVTADPATTDLEGVFGVIVALPGSSGRLRDPGPIVDRAHESGALATVVADPLALVLVSPPGEAGADVVVGSTQRFGVPLGFGGPHAGYMAVRAGLERSLPGRLVGVSVDTRGRRALRLALQTREQHIRRERATSNICTAQVLLAVVSAFYAVHHGPDGLERIARRVHHLATRFAAGARLLGLSVRHRAFFDTVVVETPGRADEVVAAALAAGINIRREDADAVAVAFDETVDTDLLGVLWGALAAGTASTVTLPTPADVADTPDAIPDELRRSGPALTHEVFRAHPSETELMRFMRRLSDADLALDRAMIPLGSCTMKLNAAAELEPISWPELADIHPFAPLDQAEGHLRIIDDLRRWLIEITGYDEVSLQPNSGAQGEFAGLLAIRGWHHSRGEDHRDVCLIPASAHGTNAASAVMAGMRVVVVACDERGNVDVDDLRARLDEHGERLAALMITYPSTHGVYESAIREMCDLVHEHGGQVYVDGANLNALVGLARPGRFGADVSHLNLHKTFCIPHGGGGPGVGPIGVRAHLAPFLPNHPLVPEAGPSTGPGPVAAAPWGSAGILAISWMYLRMMGAAGLRRATETAIVAANYVAARLGDVYPVLYTGETGRVAHECILDTRVLKERAGITVDDVAKRLIDCGFHAPTMSFPVAGTLMVEPTESEPLAELDRFCTAMRVIAEEADRVAAGEWPADDNPLVNAPHTVDTLVADDWDHPYPRSRAAWPLGEVDPGRYWPPVSRIDGAYGDRHLVCACPPLAELAVH
ncbi:MAG: glycine dehydrogenase (aminomethyl-transferring) [Actinomyces sp.]|nr:MAG: glycine dehydrogenase (aminomethyl-transferring) [Actinomyces sp.]